MYSCGTLDKIKTNILEIAFLNNKMTADEMLNIFMIFIIEELEF